MSEILVVKREELFDKKYLQGYVDDSKENDYLSIILSHREWHEREIMEKDPTFKQVIPYVLIINPWEEKVFSYKRSKKDSEYGEKRLQGKWSWGIGGHVDFSTDAAMNAEDPITYALTREIYEETGVEILTPPDILGYINDDSTEVGKVHFGLLYVVITDLVEATPRDKEITEGKFRTIKELEKIISDGEDVETWSNIAFRHLKYLI